MTDQKPQFTPGPWSYGPASNYQGFYVAPEGRLPTLAACEVHNFPGATEANARLIAAAPDGYTAADNSVARLETLLTYTTTLTPDDQAVVQECIADLRSFLSKARGEQ